MNTKYKVGELRKMISEKLVNENKEYYKKLYQEKKENLMEGAVDRIVVQNPTNVIMVRGFESSELKVDKTKSSTLIIEVTTSVYGTQSDALENKIRENVKPLINDGDSEKNVPTSISKNNKIVGRFQNWGTEKFGKEFRIEQKVYIQVPQNKEIKVG